MMRVGVDAVGILAPGIEGWEGARRVLSGREPLSERPVSPMPLTLPPAERRRSSPTVRLAISVAEQALEGAHQSPADMAMVFASAEAAGAITHQLCEVLAGTREVSPTQFHNSVHNAPSGYYSIANGAKRGASSICRGPYSFAAGLLAAAAQAHADEVPVLFACYDSPLPAPLSDVMPLHESTAIALVLARDAAGASVGAWDIGVEEGRCEVEWPAWVPQRWRPNASAVGLAALRTLCEGETAVARLPLSPGLALALRRC